MTSTLLTVACRWILKSLVSLNTVCSWLFVVFILNDVVYADSHVDPTTAVQSVPMSPSLGSGQILQSVPLRSYLPQPNFDDTSDSDKTGPFLQADDTIDKGDNMSVISDIVSDHHDDSNMKGVKVIIKKEGSKSGPA